jgi:hypothetical protein
MSGPPGSKRQRTEFLESSAAPHLRRQNRQVSDTSMTARWVATRGSAKQAAGAFLRLTLRRPRWWVFVTVVELLVTVLVALSFDEGYVAVTRVMWGAVYALVPTLGIAGVVLGVGYLLNRRLFGQRLREGVVLESGIGERCLVLRGPIAETRLAFDGIASLRMSGSWVFLQQTGSPVLGVWPAELFPPADLARMARSIEARTS